MNEILPGGSDTSSPLNLNKRIKYLTSIVNCENKVLLDCGCGEGDYLILLNKMGFNSYGVEYSKAKVKIYSKKNVDAKKVIVGDIENLPYKAVFDIIVINEVIEHISDDKRALNSMFNALKPGGKLVIFAPNRLYPFETHGVYNKKSNKMLPFYLPFIPYIPLTIGKCYFRYWARNYFPWELRKLVMQQSFVITHNGYVWQTVENITGKMHPFIIKISPFLRVLFSVFEKAPLIKCFGISQVIIATKP